MQQEVKSLEHTGSNKAKYLTTVKLHYVWKTNIVQIPVTYMNFRHITSSLTNLKKRFRRCHRHRNYEAVGYLKTGQERDSQVMKQNNRALLKPFCECHQSSLISIGFCLSNLSLIEQHDIISCSHINARCSRPAIN